MRSTFVLCIISIVCWSACANPQDEPYKAGAISAATPEAVAAGSTILYKGGNAIDAAVAISFSLGVSEPAMSGIGGGTQILLALPGREPIAVNGATLSPAATPVETRQENLVYHRRSTIPSTVKVLWYVWEKYGSGKLAWPELLEPAISQAERGFPVGEFRHKVFKKYERALQSSPFQTHLFLLENGSIPAVGDSLKQPLLAKTLRRLAEYGADDFYSGQIAGEIAADMAQQGGWISLEDLRSFPDPVELKPLRTNYRGYDVYAQPPPCGGWAAMLALNILENYPAGALQAGSKSRLQKIVKALYLAHKDRKEAPVSDLTHFEKITARKLDKTYAKQILEQYHPPESRVPVKETGGETTHFSLVDKDGMAVAVSASINAYFGAKAAAPNLGFLYNSYMDDFETGKPDHPFSIGPGLMNYSSMSPTIIQKNGETVLVIGSPGSARIISTVAQLTQLWMDSDLGIKKVVSAPRIHSFDGKVLFEDPDFPVAWLNHFRDEGFEIAFPSYDLMRSRQNAYFGGVHAIAREKGKWVGAADPRRDGVVNN